MNENWVKIIDFAIAENKKELIQTIKELALELRSDGDYKTANYLFNAIGMNNDKVSIASNIVYECKILEKRIGIKKMDLMSPDFDYENLISIINNKNKLEKIGPLKCLITGRPGTGKTSTVYYITQKTNKNLFYLKASNLISYLLGESQKNIDFLKEDILNLYKNSIFLIDEFDSIIGNRKENINNEYKRLIGDFNLMLDDLPNETIIFAVSNMIDLIDDAAKRRFNVLIEMNEMNPIIFLEYLKKSCNELDIEVDIKLVNKILLNLENSNKLINFSQIKNITTNYYVLKKNIYESLLKEFNLSLNIKILKDKYNFSFSEISKIVNQSDKTVKRKYENGDC